MKDKDLSPACLNPIHQRFSIRLRKKLARLPDPEILLRYWDLFTLYRSLTLPAPAIIAASALLDLLTHRSPDSDLVKDLTRLCLSKAPGKDDIRGGWTNTMVTLVLGIDMAVDDQEPPLASLFSTAA